MDNLYQQLHDKERLETPLTQSQTMNLEVMSYQGHFDISSILAHEKEIREDEKTWTKIKDLDKEENPASERYPTNYNSIGIEVVGAPNLRGEYPAASPEQNLSALWLVRLLLYHFKLHRTDVFAHGQIAPHKMPSEALKLLQQVRRGLYIGYN